MTLPIFGYRGTTDAVLIGPQGEIPISAFLARVYELAAVLPEAQYVINLCEGREGFMLGFAAALVRRQTSLLPPGQGHADWEQVAQQYPDAAVLNDRALDTPRAIDLRPYLVTDATPVDSVATPGIAEDFSAAILFTSGSTGRPTVHTKRWGQLVHGAANLAAALRWQSSARHVVIGSVPPQHMFGLETTVMLPWQMGLPVDGSRPLLPADLVSALSRCARPCWWMTTPMHLRALLRVPVTLPGLAGIVASTMSLPPEVAMAAESKWQIPVVEIYGSTETGALGMRHTARDEWWTPLPGVKLEPVVEVAAQQMRASGSHIDVPVLLSDELRTSPDGRFQWLGRTADMLKIGGKRASLSALNQWLSEIPGIDDAAYFVPDAECGAATHDEAQPAQRLAAFYVSTSLAPAQVTAALRGRLDPVFMPRPLIRVHALPRNANGKLAHAALAALFSQRRTLRALATGVDGNSSADANPGPRVVSANHPALAGHFPGNPIVPGVVLLSQVVATMLHQFPQFVPGTLLAMRFHIPLRPGTPFDVTVRLRGAKAHFDVHESNDFGESGALVAGGQWASETGAATDASK